MYMVTTKVEGITDKRKVPLSLSSVFFTENPVMLYYKVLAHAKVKYPDDKKLSVSITNTYKMSDKEILYHIETQDGNVS